jgi:recombination DNA repair RAD52 pathway protein
MIDEKQRAALQSDIPADAVTQRSPDGGKTKLDYVEAWWVIDQMNQIFGNGAWGYFVNVTLASHVPGEKHEVTYIADCCIHGPFEDIREIGGATQTGKKLGDCHENAAKSAASDALKRCCKSLGRRLGLALYEKPDGDGVRSYVEQPGDAETSELVSALDSAASVAEYEAAASLAKSRVGALSKSQQARVIAARATAKKRIGIAA